MFYTSQMVKNPRLFLTVASCFVGGMSISGHSRAEVESEWVRHEFAESRIIASHDSVSPDADSPLFLGWQVKLPKGWKTYWRTPGDAGRPASFDWRGSTNLKSAEVLYPLPERFEIFGIQTYGYEDGVIFPIRLRPERGGQPIHIELSTWFMACLEICVPFEADFTLDLPAAEVVQNRSPYADAIFSQLAKVPRSPANSGKELRILSVRLRGPAGNQRLTIMLEGQSLLSGADVIIEAPGQFRFDVPQRALIGDGTRARFVVPVGSFTKDSDLRGKTLTLTYSDGWGLGIEQMVRIDSTGRAVADLAKAD